MKSLLNICLLSLAISVVACKEEAPKKTFDTNQLKGDWTFTSGSDNGKATSRFEGVNFSFNTESSQLNSNFFELLGASLNQSYSLNGDTIVTDQKLRFAVKTVSATNLTLVTNVSGHEIELGLSKQ